MNNIIKSYSWRIYNSKIAIKDIDKSFIKYGETGIPKDIVHFFEIEQKMGLEKNIKLTYLNREFEGLIRVSNEGSLRTKLLLDIKLKEVIEERLGDFLPKLEIMPKSIDNYKLPKLRIEKIDSFNYIISFLKIYDMENIHKDYIRESDINYILDRNYQETHSLSEIDIINIFEYYGQSCYLCDFNFEIKYGEKGINCIDICRLDENLDILDGYVPICSNCLKVMERQKGYL